jgi:hypothetical protein
MQPGTGGQTPQFKGGAKYETRLTGVRMTVEHWAIRAQHRDLQKYKAWANRVADGVQAWFEPHSSEASP